MIEQKVDPAVLSFGEKYLDYLIATEIVSRGTGPAEFVPKGKNDVPLIFDMFILDELDLPDIWRDPDVIDARDYALTLRENRGEYFEMDYANARTVVWEKYNHLYEEALVEAKKIVDPVAKMSRINDLNSLKIHFDYAGYNLGLREERPTFARASENTVGHVFEPTVESIDAMVPDIMRQLEEQGFKEGNLEQRMDAFRGSLEYIKAEDVVSTYETLMKRLLKSAVDILGVSEDYFEFEVVPLGPERHNVASFEYLGKGKVRTSIKVADDTFTKPQMVLAAAHEATHLLTSGFNEMYFEATGDKYAAASTMSTATTALDEGIGEHGKLIYQDVVAELAGDQAGVIGLLESHTNLRRDLNLYMAQLAHTSLDAPNCNKEQLKDDLEQISLKYGAPVPIAKNAREQYVGNQNRHKALMYWSHYGEATKEVSSIFARFESITAAFKELIKVTKEKGPLTLQSANYAVNPAA